MSDDGPIDWEQTLFTVILHAGNSRSKAIEAAECGQEGDFEAADVVLVEAESSRCC
jgi:cellobiose-specific phosphotransferase system component IIA